jgi:hypothetical protein
METMIGARTNLRFIARDDVDARKAIRRTDKQGDGASIAGSLRSWQ